MRAIVTAQDAEKFSEATVYTVTYDGGRDNDTNVRWSYIQDMVRRGLIDSTITACDAGGSGKREIMVTL